MKRILFLALLLFAVSANAQNIKLYLKMAFKNEDNGEEISNVKITVKDVEKDEIVKHLKSDANGNVTRTSVPINKLYWIHVEKEGWCTKTYYLDTRHDNPEDLPRIVTFILDETLFSVENAKAFDFMKEEPMREYFFSETGGFTWKKEKGIRADKKLKLIRLNHLSDKDAEKFLNYMEEAERHEKAGEKEDALKLFEKAQKILPSKEVEEAIKRVGG